MLIEIIQPPKQRNPEHQSQRLHQEKVCVNNLTTNVLKNNITLHFK